MAFHVACPITCRKICDCKLGFPKELQSEKGRNEFLEEIAKIEAFLNDPWGKKRNGQGTVQVLVPKVVVTPAPPPPTQVIASPVVDRGGDAAAEEGLLSSQTKRAAMQRKATAASVVAEDFARRFESGDTVVGATKDLAGEEQGLSNAKVMCRLCYSGENEGSERARKLLSCNSCSKKYHRSCLKSWAQNRDLFHWSSWTCPSCRICEVCRRTGDPNKLMFCKRCDGAYHCYCQQPPHKNVSSGPYLCPKHTRCHSCASTVPGNGLSVRWFLGYTCCDACGRLFVKGNYCPVCLKVYRDSESTPMVCCDICQRWVHCQCDGISDEKYLQFQVDNNLQYRCATCRGECYQVRDLEDAVQELWRRRDIADRDLTASLRAAAGLPTQEEIFSISPYSDDEDDGPALKSEYGRSLKFSLKGVVDKSPKKSKEYGKKSTNKKNSKKKTPVFGKFEQHIEGHCDAQSIGYIMSDNKDEDAQSLRSGEPDMPSFPIAGSLNDGVCSVNQAGVVKHRFINEFPLKDQMNSNRRHVSDTVGDIEKHSNKSKNTKGPKLVIHLGARNKNAANSPMSDASNHLREHELTTSNGSEDMAQQRANDKLMDRQDTASKFSDVKGENIDHTDQIKGSKRRGKEGNMIKLRKLNPESDHLNTAGGKLMDARQSVSPVKARVSFGKRSTTTGGVAAGTGSEISAMRGEKSSADPNDDNRVPSLVSHSLQKELKPSLRLKFKNPYSDNQNSWAPTGEEEKSLVKGQRSKRKRPSPFVEKSSSGKEDKAGHSYEDKSLMDEIMDANWIIQKLGKRAIGKKVEVHQPSNNSWHKGTVIDVFEGTPMVSVTLDDGKDKNVDLEKQGIRFYSQKQRR